MSISNNVYATTSVEDFLCDVTYVSEEDTPLINAENAVSWVRAFLDVKYDAKQDNDTDAKNLADWLFEYAAQKQQTLQS